MNKELPVNLAPIEGKILFFAAGKALAEKKIGMKAGPDFLRIGNLDAPKKTTPSKIKIFATPPEEGNVDWINFHFFNSSGAKLRISKENLG